DNTDGRRRQRTRRGRSFFSCHLCCPCCPWLNESCRKASAERPPAPAATLLHGERPFEETLQIVRQCLRAGVSLRRVFLQALQHDRLQLARHRRDKLARRRRRLAHDAPQRLERRGRVERRPASQRLIQDRAQRVNVRRWADVLAVRRLF